jgi:hypothetical protein
MEAILEGNRIQNLIASAPPASATESLKFLLKEKKRHSAAVLRKQKEVRLQAQTLLQEDAALILGRFAEQNSQKSTQNALGRAAMAT